MAGIVNPTLSSCAILVKFCVVPSAIRLNLPFNFVVLFFIFEKSHWQPEAKPAIGHQGERASVQFKKQQCVGG